VDVHEGPLVDIQGDISDLSRFESGSVTEIYASHCLEHFPHVRTLDVLKEWRRVMAKGGKVFVSVPDMDYIVRHYQK
jgi:predicted SAM-dependent methyltransferase